jgi:hypothetical protein
MFLDKPLDQLRLALATKLGIAVVCEEAEQFRVMNPSVNANLSDLFPSGPGSIVPSA